MALFWDAAPVVPSPELTLEPGQTYLPLIGWYWYKGGRNTAVQRYDPIARMWRFSGDDSQAMRLLFFDGRTTRIANTSGCAVAAAVTTASTSYTTAPTVTASEGSSTWQAIVGGAISTAAVIAAAGSGYTYPPLLWIEQPPNPGLQATAYSTVSNGSISAVTVVDQGAGYTLPPTVNVVPDSRDTTGSGGVVNLALTGAGTITGVVCTNHGNPITSGTVPTLTFSSGSAAASAIMDWAITSVSISAAGAGYTGAAAAVTATGAGGFFVTATTYLGGPSTTGMVPAQIDITTSSAGGLTTVAAIIEPGHYHSAPTPAIIAAQAYTTVGTLVFTMGGISSTAFLMPAQQ